MQRNAVTMEGSKGWQAAEKAGQGSIMLACQGPAPQPRGADTEQNGPHPLRGRFIWARMRTQLAKKKKSRKGFLASLHALRKAMRFFLFVWIEKLTFYETLYDRQCWATELKAAGLHLIHTGILKSQAFCGHRRAVQLWTHLSPTSLKMQIKNKTSKHRRPANSVAEM